MEIAIPIPNITCKRAPSVTDTESVDVMDVESDSTDKLQTELRQKTPSVTSELIETTDTVQETQR